MVFRLQAIPSTATIDNAIDRTLFTQAPEQSLHRPLARSQLGRHFVREAAPGERPGRGTTKPQSSAPADVHLLGSPVRIEVHARNVLDSDVEQNFAPALASLEGVSVDVVVVTGAGVLAIGHAKTGSHVALGHPDLDRLEARVVF